MDNSQSIMSDDDSTHHSSQYSKAYCSIKSVLAVFLIIFFCSQLVTADLEVKDENVRH